jgi:hypothetical protein
MHRYALFVVTYTACGASRPLYGGVYTIGGYGEGYFFLNMDGSIISGSDRLRLSLFSFDVSFVEF